MLDHIWFQTSNQFWNIILLFIYFHLFLFQVSINLFLGFLYILLIFPQLFMATFQNRVQMNDIWKTKNIMNMHLIRGLKCQCFSITRRHNNTLICDWRNLTLRKMESFIYTLLNQEKEPFLFPGILWTINILNVSDRDHMLGHYFSKMQQQCIYFQINRSMYCINFGSLLLWVSICQWFQENSLNYK